MELGLEHSPPGVKSLFWQTNYFSRKRKIQIGFSKILNYFSLHYIIFGKCLFIKQSMIHGLMENKDLFRAQSIPRIKLKRSIIEAHNSDAFVYQPISQSTTRRQHHHHRHHVASFS